MLQERSELKAIARLSIKLYRTSPKLILKTAEYENYVNSIDISMPVYKQTYTDGVLSETKPFYKYNATRICRL